MPAAQPSSRKASVASVDSEPLIDQSSAAAVELAVGPSATDDFTAPVDEILSLIQNVYDKRLKLSAKDMQFVSGKVHEMKNQIINLLVPNTLNHKVNNVISSNPHITKTANNLKEWPSLPQTKSRSTLLVKPDPSKKFTKSDVSELECRVNNLITEEKIEATIFSSAPTKNGDIVIKFDQKDNVKSIAKKVENNLGYQTHSRSVILPKLTISYVPKYISVEKESVEESIIRSNEWLDDLMDDGETFEVIFSYDVRDWKSIVCRVSPNIRSHIIRNGNSLRIENRSCPVKDRFHIPQCGKCLGFGHRSRMCMRDRPACSHCSEEHHRKDCPHRDNDHKLLCSNCMKSNEITDPVENQLFKHSAFSHSCPMYLKQMKRQIERTHWGDGPIPHV